MVACTVTNPFTSDLTDEARDLCAWVAEQARGGVSRIRYADVKVAMDIDEMRLTCVLREMRERRDDLHRMIHSPIVNTSAPYFTVHRDADCIWDHYCQAEMDAPAGGFAAGSLHDEGPCRCELDSLMCAV